MATPAARKRRRPDEIQVDLFGLESASPAKDGPRAPATRRRPRREAAVEAPAVDAQRPDAASAPAAIAAPVAPGVPEVSSLASDGRQSVTPPTDVATRPVMAAPVPVEAPPRPARRERSLSVQFGQSAAMVVRDTFSMPPGDHALILQWRSRAAEAGHPCTKSEVVRAGLVALSSASAERIVALLGGLQKIKPGRKA